MIESKYFIDDKFCLSLTVVISHETIEKCDAHFKKEKTLFNNPVQSPSKALP